MQTQVDPPKGSSSRPRLTGIPTDDPQAALQFCRWLAANLATGVPGGKVFPGQEAGSLQEGLSTQPVPAEEGAWSETKVSVVIPVYNEQENLDPLYDRLTTVLSQCEPCYEIVFVDDGSRDRGLELLHALEARDYHVKVVELARNFGHQVAISAGLDHACGQGVVIIDADLQDPPEVLPQFIAKWREGYDVVYAIREHRKEGWFKRIAYATFYRLLERIANIRIPLDAGDFCIMDRRVVDLLNGMPERNRFVRGIRSWVGLDQVGLVYERHERNAGEPKYTFRRLLYLALDGLVSFSYVPLRMISILGLSVSLVSILLAMFYLIKALTLGLYPPGFATLVVAVFFLAGIQLITIGVIGEYVGRIFEEVKQRPLYVIRRVTGGMTNAHPDVR
jgi:glycosyltransferase involved in cell wall biosynthesis